MLIALVAFAALASQQPDSPPTEEKRGLVETSARASPGYTLIWPLQSKSVWLIDLDGAVVHEWKTDAAPGQTASIGEDGHLLRAERVDNDNFFGGGQGGRVREYDWDGKLVWEYVCCDATRCQHHEAKFLPNGHLLLIAWEKKTGEEAFNAGRDSKALESDQFWPDMLLEIEPTRPSGGKVVWEWHAWDHLIQSADAAKPNFGAPAEHSERIDINADRPQPKSADEQKKEDDHLRQIGYATDGPNARSPGGRGPGGPGGHSRGGDWMHANSISYDAKLDLVLVSVHDFSEVWVIDHSTTTAQSKSSNGGRYGRGGDLVARFGNPVMHKAGSAMDRTLFAQHDVQWIGAGLPGAGHVLVFNNGEGADRKSSVDELAIDFGVDALKAKKKPELAWTYTSEAINSSHISGAQRLPNGDTLICNGESGRVVEVTPKGEVVWNYLNPFGGDAPMGGPGGGRGEPGKPPSRDGPPGDDHGGPPDDRAGAPDARGGPRGGARGPHNEHSLFRAWRYPPNFAGIAKHMTKK